MAKKPEIRLSLSPEDLAKLRKLQLYHGYETVNQALRHAIDFALIFHDQTPYPERLQPRKV